MGLLYQEWFVIKNGLLLRMVRLFNYTVVKNSG